jgi:hypothetical protein
MWICTHTVAVVWDSDRRHHTQLSACALPEHISWSSCWSCLLVIEQSTVLLVTSWSPTNYNTVGHVGVRICIFMNMACCVFRLLVSQQLLQYPLPSDANLRKRGPTEPYNIGAVAGTGPASAAPRSPWQPLRCLYPCHRSGCVWVCGVAAGWVA